MKCFALSVIKEIEGVKPALTNGCKPSGLMTQKRGETMNRTMARRNRLSGSATVSLALLAVLVVSLIHTDKAPAYT